MVPVPEYHCGTRTRVPLWYPYPYPFHCTRTRVPIVAPLPVFQHGLVPVPISLYPCFNMAWYPYSYPSTHCGTRTRTCTRVSTWLGTRTRTHTHFIVPIPEYPLWYPDPCFNMAWYPYSYPYPFHCTHTCTQVPTVVPGPMFQHGLVPVLVPIPISLYPYPGTCSGTRLQLWRVAAATSSSK